MHNNFPKVLFITPHAFNRVTGGGITFSNLFAGWPKDRIATIHCDSEATTGDVCSQYFELGEEEITYSAPFSFVQRFLGRGTVAGGPTGPSISESKDPEIYNTLKKSDLLTLIQNVRLSVLGDSLPQRAHISLRLDEWINTFQPDVIYTILGSNGLMLLIDEIQNRYGLPTVVHFMDDWMSSQHRRGILGPKMRSEMEHLVQKLVQNAEKCLGISAAMCDAFTIRYDRPFEAFQNTVDITRWSTFKKTDVSCASPADILYVGSIFPNAQLESLVRCCQAVAILNDQGLDSTLTISSPSGHAERYRNKLAIHSAIRIIDTIRDDETFFKRIGEADLLLLPVNFSGESVQFIRYSMPTKVPAYLCIGTPILAHGPCETAQIAYAQTDGWALTVTELSLTSLVMAMERALKDTKLRTTISVNAQSAAVRNHSSATVRIRFQEMLKSAASGSRQMLRKVYDAHAPIKRNHA